MEISFNNTFLEIVKNILAITIYILILIVCILIVWKTLIELQWVKRAEEKIINILNMLSIIAYILISASMCITIGQIIIYLYIDLSESEGGSFIGAIINLIVWGWILACINAFTKHWITLGKEMITNDMIKDVLMNKDAKL